MRILEKFSFHAILAIAVLFVSKLVTAQAGPGDAILGTWLTAEKGAKVEVYKQGDRYFGKLLNAGAGDKAPADTILLKNLSYDSGLWSGQIYAPKRGKDYPVTIKLADPETLELNVQAGMMSRSLKWKKVEQ